MAHNLAMKADGTAAMAYAGGERPWHGLGKEVSGKVTAKEMMEAAGLDWKVILEPVYTAGSRVIDGYKAATREDNAKVLGIVGEKFRPIQNVEAFDFLDSVVTTGAVQYHTAGALGAGERVWVLVKLPGVISPIKGDDVEKFLLFANGHDGSLAIRMLWTPVRVVCQNTLNGSLAEAFEIRNGKITSKVKKGYEDKAVSIRHVGNVAKKMEEAATVLNLGLKMYDAAESTFGKLAAFKPSKEQVQSILNSIFPYEVSDRMTKESKVGNAGVQNRIRDLMETGKGTEIPGVKGTGWGLYNAITEYVDHERVTTGEGTKQTENRLKSQWFGSGAKIKAQAAQAVLQLV